MQSVKTFKTFRRQCGWNLYNQGEAEFSEMIVFNPWRGKNGLSGASLNKRIEVCFMKDTTQRLGRQATDYQVSDKYIQNVWSIL